MTIFLIIIAVIFIAFSLRFTWWALPKKGLLVLMYHNVEEPSSEVSDGERPFFISPKRFKEQVEYLLKHGFTPINFDDLMLSCQGKKALPSKPVMITFDDGYLNNYQNAFPILKEKQIKANIFLIGSYIGVKEDFMSWPQVLEMQESGLVTFGSHTLNHLRLRSLTEEDALKELTASKKFLEEKLSKDVIAFCYPFGAGAFDKRIRPLVFKAGYLFDFSTKKGISKLPLNKDKTIRRAFPRYAEPWFDFYLQVTRGMSKL